MSKIIYEQKSCKIIGACIEVHKELGSGFLEGAYQEALNQLTWEHESQIINYLKVTNLKIGFLFNFGENSLKYKRFVL
jgi:hypothetical protein